MDDNTSNVLLIEDSLDQAKLLSELLAVSEVASRFHLETAITLEAALERVRRGNLGLILLDLNLPDSKALETFIRVAEAAPQVAIVVLNGSDDEALALETMQLGAQDYLVKGHVGSHTLFRAMQYAIERKRGQFQLKRAYDELDGRIKERTAALQQTNLLLQKEILERKRAEENTLESNRQLADALGQLRAAQQRGLETSQDAAGGDAAASVVADFDRAQESILAFCEMLISDSATAADALKVRTYAGLILESAQECAGIVHRLQRPGGPSAATPPSAATAPAAASAPAKTFGGGQAPSAKPKPGVFFNELLERTIAQFQPRLKMQAAQGGVEIDVYTEFGALPAYRGDGARLMEAFAGFIAQAVENIPLRGTLSVRTEWQAPLLRVSIGDDGIGLAEELYSRCLQASDAAGNAAEPGAASVVNACRLICEQGGRVKVVNAAGRGTTFQLEFSMAVESAAAADAPQPAQRAGGLRILVVDDEPLVREVIGVYLGEDDHQITTACNGREGLEKYRGGEFDLVLTDRAMPEMTGPQLAVEIKKINASQPVILLTGFGETSGGGPRGIDLVIGKPFTINTLREAISKVRGLCAAP